VPTPSGRLTQVGAVVGTPGYIAPEQAFGQKIDARSDLYALGCVAWWLLCAAEIFPRGTDEGETLRAHIQDAVPSLRARVKGWLPQGLEDLVHACLEKKASDRPHDAREMIERLRAIHIPEEYAWSELRAHAWWHQFRPAIVVAAPEQATMAGEPSASDQPTVVGRAPPKRIVPRFD
jgi:serine/threonine-protein kinase